MADDTTPSQRPPLVLLAHDHEWLARSLESILEPNGYVVLRADSGRHAIELALRTLPDLIIVHDALGGEVSSLDVCRTLRAEARIGASTPIVVTASDAGGRARRHAALAAGAWEFCGQPLDSEPLLLQLDNFIRARREVQRVRASSIVDAVSGLYNMRGLAQRAREIGAEARRRRAALACLAFAPALDIPEDAQLLLEQRLSHLVARIGETCRRVRRASDVFGHVGRAEFAVLAPSTEEDGAQRLFQRLQDSLTSILEEESEAPRAVRLCAGYCIVADASTSAIGPLDMLTRAAAALRTERRGVPSGALRRSGEVTERPTH